MVAMFEFAFLIAGAILGVLWFRHTNIYRAHRRSGADPGQFGTNLAGRFGANGGAAGVQGHRSHHVPKSE
jgi:hypothetical protein